MSGINIHNWDELSSIIKKSKTILLSTHINADGDGLGSQIAFYYYLRSLNKICRIIWGFYCFLKLFEENFKIVFIKTSFLY